MAKLTEGPIGGGTIPGGSLRGWCAEQNAKPISARMGRWYFIAKNTDGAEIIDSLTGADADNVRKLIDGKLEDFYRWPAERMTGYRRWLWSVAERGMTEPLQIRQHEPEPAE